LGTSLYVRKTRFANDSFIQDNLKQGNMTSMSLFIDVILNNNFNHRKSIFDAARWSAFKENLDSDIMRA
jgi:hypothetical protein